MGKPKMVIITAMLSLIINFTFGEKVATLTGLQKPMTMAIDNQHFYVTEKTTIFIYSLSDFKLIKKFGREGQGPQEFQTLPHLPVTVDVTSDQLIAASMRKISYFSKQGDFIREVRAKNQALRLKLFDKGFLGWSQKRQQGLTYSTVNIFDSELNKIKEIYDVVDSFQGRGRGYKVLHKVFTYYTFDQKIFLPGDDDSSINVFNKDMEKLLTIEVKQDRRKVGAKFRKRLTHYFKTSPESKNIYEFLKPLIFPDYFPVISDFFVDDGRVYVMTWKREKGKNEFFIYTVQGKFLEQKMIPFRYETDLSPYPSMVNKGNLYQLVENQENEDWELYISKIN